MNLTLNQAKRKKNDEFYTLLEDIEQEMSHYDFTGKIIYCNCEIIMGHFFLYIF